jgi:hypothetical protein
MKWRELLGFFGCFIVGFACTRTDGSVATETGAQLCKSNADCATDEGCDLLSGAGVCKPLAVAAAAGSGSRAALPTPAAAGSGGLAALPTSCTNDSQCAYGEECEYEHGKGYCKPHHDDSYEADGGEADGGAKYDSGAPDYPPCTTDGDCTPYQECSYADDNSGPGGGDGDDRGGNSGHGHGGDEYDDKAPTYPPRTGVCKSRSGGHDDDY